MIGYPSGQDGAVVPAGDYTLFPAKAFPLGRGRFIKVISITSFIDQACSVKMAVNWSPSFFACLCTSTSSKLWELVQVAVITYPRSSNNAADIHSNYAHFTYVTLITYFKCEHLKNSLRCGLFKQSVPSRSSFGGRHATSFGKGELRDDFKKGF